MATGAMPSRLLDGQRPNVASADVQLPAVRDYEQVDEEILGTLHPTGKWFAGLGLALACMLIGAATRPYQNYWGLGRAGYEQTPICGV